MQPMMAIVTPGRWPVRCEIVSVTSCRSNNVRPHEGHDTNSVLTLRMREPCRSPKEAVRKKSTSKGASTRTPSPRPSTRSEPPSTPSRRMKRSLRSGLLPGALADCASYESLCRTGTDDVAALARWSSRREAWSLERSAVGTSTTTKATSSLEKSASSSSSASSPRSVTARGASAAAPAASRNAAAEGSRTTVVGTGRWSSSRPERSARSTTTPRPACESRESVRSCGLPKAASVPGLRYTESEVATSRNGMPTAVWQPSARYSACSSAKSDAPSAVTTEPSRWRADTVSPSLTDLGISTSRFRSSATGRVVVSSNAGTAEARTRLASETISAPMSASVLHGSSSNSGSSVNETRIVSPRPSANRAPIPMADFMRPSSPSPASVTPRCSG
mmetsp:Transcript_15939/g.64275  ORF Transcript_15939/g.64275 Transcript_15939/m.64275 type:complete len:390 (+) Transcript_15939:646-1815(+)